MNKFTLQNVISKRRYSPELNWHDFEYTLTDEHKKNFLSVFGHGCRRETKNALWRAANNNFSGMRSCGILDRVSFHEDGNVQYCAGQDYPSEVAFVRNWIKKYY